MVTEFRNFLNKDPRYAELRERYPNDTAMRHFMPAYYEDMIPPTVARPPDTYDDEMVDDDNDFEGGEGVEGVDMMLDPQPHQLNGQAHGHAHGTVPPIPPPPPQFSNPGVGTMGSMNPLLNADHHAEQASNSPLAYASFILNQRATGSPRLSAHGHSLASMAALRHTRPNGTAGEASTASMSGPRPLPHQDPNGGPSTENSQSSG